ncbi:hypothetical protein AB0O80_10675 [Rothia kristinae]|uniref:hypothetical protein n=1 Tax=Actinomycetes TaxID=1760 RepID=UPI003430B57B
MQTIQQIAINAGIDFETAEVWEHVEGGVISGAIEIKKDNQILEISNFCTIDEETGEPTIEGYQSCQRWAEYNPEDTIFAEDFDDTEDGALATIKAFLS